MSYLTCTNCGQKALSVATRCPHCGRPFGNPQYRPAASGSGRRRVPVALLIIGVVVIMLVVYGVNAVRPRFSVTPPAAPPAAPTVSAPPPRQAPREPLPATVESVHAVPPTPPQSRSRPPAPVADSVKPVAPTPTPEPAATGDTQQRYANTWANVRADRGNTAAVIRVLRPGEVVLVDSLKLGWYRVVSDQEAIGYVDQHYLDTSPPAQP